MKLLFTTIFQRLKIHEKNKHHGDNHVPKSFIILFYFEIAEEEIVSPIYGT